MGAIKGVIGGCIGGIIGGAVWVAIAHFLHAEIGWIAWGIGVVVGMGVAITRGSGNVGVPAGIVAAVIAVLSIVGAKYAVAAIAAANINLAAPTAENLISDEADSIVSERMAGGKPVNWKPGMTADNASSQADYPADIWREAQARWEAKPREQQDRELAERKAKREETGARMRAAIRDKVFQGSFGLFDLLWGVLAAGSAFKIGSGVSASDDERVPAGE